MGDKKLRPSQSSEQRESGSEVHPFLPTRITKITKQFNTDLVNISFSFFFLPVDLDSDVLPCSFVPGNHQVCSEKKEKCYYEEPKANNCFILLVLRKLGTVVLE